MLLLDIGFRDPNGAKNMDRKPLSLEVDRVVMHVECGVESWREG